MKQIKNPLKGKVFFTEEGVEIERATLLKPMFPSVSPREWDYLLLDGYDGELPKWASEWREKRLGSRVTQWRIKKSLIKKGYIQK